MRRVFIAIGAVAYLAACWAPQLWTGTADAQEKPEAPQVHEEIRARRIVVVDQFGDEIGVFEVKNLSASLTLRSEFLDERTRALVSGNGLISTREEKQEDESWREVSLLALSNSPDFGRPSTCGNGEPSRRRCVSRTSAQVVYP